MTSLCSIELLKAALAGELSSEDEATLDRHLNECPACNSTIEELAGGEKWTKELEEMLAEDELDADIPAREEFSEIDFTVEHLDPSDDSNALGQLGGYDVLEVIGRGGMGVVLKGYDRALKRCVAVKVLAPHLAQSSLAKKRFAREAQAAAAVVHSNVLAIHQVQPTGRLPFLVMPLVAGESLAQRLAAKGSLELTEVLRIGMQAAAGLAAAHEQGLVHRDVKPANILLEKGIERAVLTDFGLARAADDVALTRWGIIAGTPQYMSPEQAKGEPVDGRSDLFSLGCVLYEMATGVSPFRTDSTMATLRRLVDEEPQAMSCLNPELPPWFITIVEKLLDKDPTKRFSSAKEVCDCLEGCLAHVQQPNNVPLPASLPTVEVQTKPRWSIRRWIATIAGTFIFAALAAGAVAVATADPPDIAGVWQGEGWNKVILKQTESGEYTGTYADAFGKQPGTIELKWSRIERQYTGTWTEGQGRFGDISVQLVDNEIRGAYTTSRKSRVNPATPKLAPLAWKKVPENPVGAVAQTLKFGNVKELDLNHQSLVSLRSGKLLSLPDNLESPRDEIDWARLHRVDLIVAKDKDGSWSLNTFPLVSIGDLTVEHWQAVTQEELDVALRLGTNKLEVGKCNPGEIDETVRYGLPPKITSPLTFAIGLSDGTKGILQVKGGDADKISIRYKLLEQAEAASSAPARSLSVPLPHGGTVVLHALGEVSESGITWWTPDGNAINGKPEWQRFREHRTLGSRFAVYELAFPDAGPPAAPISPLGKEFAIPYYSAVDLPKPVNGIQPPLLIGFGAGQWITRGKLIVGQAFKHGDFECMIERVEKALPKNITVQFWFNCQPETEAAVIAVSKRGERFELGHTFGPDTTPVPRNRKWNLVGFAELAESDIDYFELVTRPRYWALFEGWVDIASQTVDPTKLRGQPISGDYVERIAAGTPPVPELNRGPNIHYVTNTSDGSMQAWDITGRAIRPIEDVAFLSRAPRGARNDDGIQLWLYHPEWIISTAKKLSLQIFEPESGQVVSNSGDIDCTTSHWFVFSLLPNRGRHLPDVADVKIEYVSNDEKTEVFDFKQVHLRSHEIGIAPEADVLASSLLRKKKATTQPDAVSFGPVIERVVNDDDPKLGNFLIDFESGNIFSPPADKSPKKDPKGFEKWMIENGIDALGETKESVRGLMGIDMVVIPIANENWNMSPDSLTKESAHGKAGRPVPINGKGQLPATYIIQTREGGKGVLQIVDFTDNPRGVKIRYKLLQNSDRPPAAAHCLFLNGELSKSVHPPLVAQKCAKCHTGSLDTILSAASRSQATKPAEEWASRFGPVIEQTLNDTRANKGNDVLSIRDNKVLSHPAEIRDPELLSKWAKENRIDIAFEYSQNRWVIQSPQLKIGDLKNEQWDNAAASDIETSLLHESQIADIVKIRKFGDKYLLPVDAKAPLTFALQLVDGTRGILQIAAFDRDSRSVKLRYKLLQEGWNSAPAGEHPRNVTRAPRGQYQVQLPNGVEVSVRAVMVGPRQAGIAGSDDKGIGLWRSPNGEALEEQPADRLEYSTALPDGADATNEVLLLLTQSLPKSQIDSRDSFAEVAHDCLPKFTSYSGAVFLDKQEKRLKDTAQGFVFKTLPETMVYRCAVSIGPWERVAGCPFNANETKLTKSENKASVTFTMEDGGKSFAIRHNVDRQNYHLRVIAHLKNGQTEHLVVHRIETQDEFMTYHVSMPVSLEWDYLLLERRPCYWAEISDIVLRPQDKPVADDNQTARLFLEAIRDDQIGNAAQYLASDAHVAGLKSNAKSVREMYAGNLEALTTLENRIAEEDWVAYRTAPQSGSSNKCLALVLQRTRAGWRIVKIDDFNKELSLQKFLNRERVRQAPPTEKASLSPREVAEIYLQAALDRQVDRALLFAAEGKSAGVRSEIEKLGSLTGNRKLKVDEVWFNEHVGHGVAITEETKIWSGDGGRYVIQLRKIGGRWLVESVHFESLSSEIVTGFREATGGDAREPPHPNGRVDHAQMLRRTAPYPAIRWNERVSNDGLTSAWTAEVLIDGQWYVLQSINDLPLEKIITFSRKQYGDQWQKRFNEDLVQVLSEMHEPIDSTVKLGLRDLKTGETKVLDRAPLTSENRRAIWMARKAEESRPVAAPNTERIDSME
jgi:serine/threonine-protein kinase